MDSLALPPTTSLTDPRSFLTALAIRLAARSKGGEPDLDFAGRYLLRVFREGKFGKWTLDGLGRGGEVVDAVVDDEVIPPILSTPPPEPGLTIDAAVQAFFARKDTKEDMSGHQRKWAVKVAQATARDIKRRSMAVVHVKGTGIASARRRVYRR